MKKALQALATVLGLLWLAALALGPQALAQLGLQLNEHAHGHVHAHGHPFIDARAFGPVPNAMDVLTNLPFALVGLWGLVLLARRRPAPGLTPPLLTFFAGLLLTAAGSACYHWAPTPWGLMLDRLGMAVAFAGVLALLWADRVSEASATRVLWALLLIAPASAVLPYSHGQLLPWVVLQFGGLAMVLVAGFGGRAPAGMGVAWWAVGGAYVVAKWLELADAAVFTATGALISGHSAKHLVAALAAVPVLLSLHRLARRSTPNHD